MKPSHAMPSYAMASPKIKRIRLAARLHNFDNYFGSSLFLPQSSLSLILGQGCNLEGQTLLYQKENTISTQSNNGYYCRDSLSKRDVGKNDEATAHRTYAIYGFLGAK
jgi:hypothetical protein